MNSSSPARARRRTGLWMIGVHPSSSPGGPSAWRAQRVEAERVVVLGDQAVGEAEAGPHVVVDRRPVCVNV